MHKNTKSNEESLIGSKTERTTNAGYSYFKLWPIGVISCMLIALIYQYNPSKSTYKITSENLAKYQKEVDMLKSKVKQVEELQSKPVGPISQTTTMGEMRSNFDTRITRIEDLLQGDPIRSLSVPILRRDLDNINVRLTEYQVAIREDLNRIYNVFMWALGILVTIILAFLGHWQKKMDALFLLCKAK